MKDKGLPGKDGRIRQHTQGLVQEVRTWMELQMELLAVRLWERMENQFAKLLAGSASVLLGGIALVFGLVAGALWLGSVLGHESWGFLIVGGATGLIAWILHVVRRLSESRDEETAAGLSSDHATS